MSATPNLLLLRFKRQWKIIILLGVLSTLFAMMCQEYDLLEVQDSERGSYDNGLKAFTWINKHESARTFSDRWFGFLKKKPEKSKNVVIVAIDDLTFAEIAANRQLKRDYGSWPYSRNIWADLLQELRYLGAKAVVFDMTMEQENPDKTSDRTLAEEIADGGHAFYLGFTFTADPNTAQLPAVDAGNRFPEQRVLPVLLPEVTEDDPFGEKAPTQDATVKPVTPEEIAAALAVPVRTEGGATVPLVYSSAADRAQGSREYKSPIPPITPLVHVGPGFGVVEPEADEDGKLRRTSFVYSDGRNTYVNLGLSVLADLERANEIVVAPGEIRVGTKVIKTNPRGDAEINYGGTLADRFWIYPLIYFVRDNRGPEIAAEKRAEIDALEKEGKLDKKEADEKRAALVYKKDLKREDFEGKVVIVGGFGLGTADSKPTPLEPGTPAVVKHAAELDSMLGGRFILEAPYWVSVLLTFFIALLSAAVILVIKRSAIEVAWPVALYFGFFLVTGALLVYTDTHVLSEMPSLAGSVASIFAIVINHFFADKQAEKNKEMLSRYMEPQLVEQMVEKGETPKLGGENREVTAFFSDIRGFSGFTEMWRDDPQKLVKFLNGYLTRVTQVLFDHGGCVDKYIGDAVVCIFGAPFKDKEHARHACEAALAVLAEISAMREEFRQQGLPDVYTRIGLNSDVMFVGNFGSEQIFDYTAMGDGMNLAARLEGANKNYDSSIMIGENTYRLAAEFIEVRELDRVRVAGKKNAVAVYELLAMKGKLDPKKKPVVQLYEQALGEYRAAKFTEAIATLQKAVELDPADGPSQILLKRCQKFVEHPPPMPFDGIANLEK